MADDPSPILLPVAHPLEYVCKDATGTIVGRTRDEALCARLRQVAADGGAGKPHPTTRHWCNHCHTQHRVSVERYRDPTSEPYREVLVPTGETPVKQIEAGPCAGMVDGLEACGGCNAFLLLLTLAQREELQKGERVYLDPVR